MTYKYHHDWLERDVSAKQIRRALADAYKAGKDGEDEPTEKIMKRFLMVDTGPSHYWS